MNFTAKEDYGLRAVLDLALHSGATPVRASEIAARQQIPEQFLEQLLATLRRGEIIRSTRGASGGYTLATAPDKVTVGDVLRSLSGPFVPADLIERTGDEKSESTEGQVVREVWGAFRTAIRSVADTTTLQDLLDKRAALLGDAGVMMHI
jgi:Rrf2 family transcriptional regulator, cysteine metabolism repressor